MHTESIELLSFSTLTYSQTFSGASNSSFVISFKFSIANGTTFAFSSEVKKSSTKSIFSFSTSIFTFSLERVSSFELFSLKNLIDFKEPVSDIWAVVLSTLILST